MKKIIVLVILSFVILAIVIRCAGGSEPSYDDEIDSTYTDEKYTEQGEIQEGTIDIYQDNVSLSEVLSNTDLLCYEVPQITENQTEQILKRKGYITSYNQDTRNANWVAWHMTRETEDGPWKRDGLPYIEDMEVEGVRQELNDWLNLTDVYDHGHLCPAADCRWDKDAMVQTFLLTNMCPQDKELNRGGWEELENRCRGWARHYGSIYIAAGPIFYSKNYQTIGNNHVGVPDAFFKVVLVMNSCPKTIGFIYPNHKTDHSLEYYVKTVDEVENITGIDFFHNIPDDIENSIEAVADLTKW